MQILACRLICPIFALLAGVLVAQSAPAAWEAIGQIGGPTQAIAADGRFVYAGTGRRLVLLDVAAGLREVGHSQVFSDLVEGVAVQNNLAFVACGRGGVHILDISVPTAPREVAMLRVRGPAEGVAVAGATLYVANGPYGLLLYDISNPSQPVLLGSAFITHNVLKVAVHGGVAYLAAAGAGLLAVGVRDPSHPVELGALATAGFSFDVAVDGSTAYVADGWAGLRSVNVSDPSHPAENSTLKTGCWAMGIGLDVGRAYVADGCEGLAVIDISNPSQSSRIAQYSSDRTDARGVAVSRGIVYVADRNWGVRALNVSAHSVRTPGALADGNSSGDFFAPRRPGIPGRAEPASHAFVSDVHDVDVQGNYAYVAAGFAGLRVIDLTQPNAPREVGAFLTRSYTDGVAVQGHYAYIVTNQQAPEARGVYILDVSDPRNPVQAGYCYLDSYWTANAAVVGAAWAIRISGNYAYVADELGIGILDVTDPSHPVWTGSARTNPGSETDETTFHVAVDGTRAYSTGTPNFGVLDISHPLTPVLLSAMTPPATLQSVAARGGRAYLATSGGLLIMDVSDGAHPAQLGQYNSGSAYGVDIAGSLAYLSVASGLVAVDVSSPSNPSAVAEFESPGFAYSVRSIGDRIYVPDSEGGLVILPRADAAAATAPAPAAGWSLGLESGGLRPYAQVVIESADDPLPASLAAPQQPAAGPVCTVNATADSGPGTIRDCLERTPSGGIVTFDPSIFPLSGPATMVWLNSSLQLDRGWITLDASNAAVMLYGRGADYPAVAITSPGNTIKGLQVKWFVGGGIVLLGGAAHNQIGGDRHAGSGPTGEGNALWKNGERNEELALVNILLDGPGVYDNLIDGNILGQDPATMAEDPFGPPEVLLQHGASWNRIGTGTPGGGNVIGSGGLELRDAATSHNRIKGNFIGADFRGTANLGGSSGVSLIEASYNTVGGNGPNEGNLLAGCHGASVLLCHFAYGNRIVGNTVGLDVTGTKLIGLGGVGIEIDLGVYNNIVEANTLAGGSWGVSLLGFGVGFNQVIGNRIGFDPTGRVVLGNTLAGILAEQAQFTRIGGSRSQDGNLIAGGQFSAVFLSEAFGSIVLGNHVGASVDGVAVGGQTFGVQLMTGARRCTVGGATAPEGNLILGAPTSGITLDGKQHLVQGNFVGIDSQGAPSPNQGGILAGMWAAGGPRDVIVQGNTIAGNLGSGGISAYGGRDTFRRNSVYSNSEGGLRLGCLDSAHCVVAPVLTGVGAASVSGTACPSCEVEVFSDAGSQGRYFEASGIANAQGAFTIVLSSPLRGPNVTATATDPDGNTSAFSTPWKLAK